MKNYFCVICGKYKKNEKPKTSYTLEKTIVLSVICIKCKIKNEEYLKARNRLRY